MNIYEARMNQQWRTVAGAFLLMFPVGVPLYWGNIAVYALSYFLIRRGSETGLGTQWIIGFFFCFQTVGFVLVGILSKHTGKRLALLLGVVLFLSGIFGTYFSLKISIHLMNFTLGVLTGLGCGFVNGMALAYALPWAGRHVCLVTAIVQTAFCSGPIFINMFFTMYTNPRDKSPSYVFGLSSYFTQQDILDNVPSSYLVFGCLCAGIQLIGFLMVREFKTEEEQSSQQEVDQSVDENVRNRENESINYEEDGQSVTPNDMIKTSSFYALWFAGLFYNNTLFIVLTYYKSYGQIWIKDDYFLACTAVAFSVSCVVFSPIWGRITDRIGVKMALMLMNAFSAVHILLLYFAPRLNKWLYLVAMILFGSSCLIFSTLLAATYKLYGKTHHSFNFGVVNSSDLFMEFISPPLLQFILFNSSWFCVLCVGAFECFASLLLITLTLQKC